MDVVQEVVVGFIAIALLVGVASAIATIPNDDVVTKMKYGSSRLKKSKKKNQHIKHEVHEATASKN